MNTDSSFRAEEIRGLLKKVETNLLKLSVVLCCLREAQQPGNPKYEVQRIDVVTAHAVLEHSINLMKVLKPALKDEVEAAPQIPVFELKDITPELLVKYHFNIKRAYDRADENNEVSF